MDSHAVLLIRTTLAHDAVVDCLASSLSNVASTDVTDIGKYVVSVDGETVIVNDEVAIGIGQGWGQKTVVLTFHPWWQRHTELTGYFNPWVLYEEFIELRNHGFTKGFKAASGTSTAFDHDVLVITGAAGIARALNHGTVIIFVSSLLIVVAISISLARDLLAVTFAQWLRPKLQRNRSASI